MFLVFFELPIFRSFLIDSTLDDVEDLECGDEVGDGAEVLLLGDPAAAREGMVLDVCTNAQSAAAFQRSLTRCS